MVLMIRIVFADSSHADFACSTQDGLTAREGRLVGDAFVKGYCVSRLFTGWAFVEQPEWAPAVV